MLNISVEGVKNVLHNKAMQKKEEGYGYEEVTIIKSHSE